MHGAMIVFFTLKIHWFSLRHEWNAKEHQWPRLDSSNFRAANQRQP